MLVATGEQVSAALLAIRLHALGLPAVSFLAHQLRIATDSNHGRARIKSIDAVRVMQRAGCRTESRSSPATRASTRDGDITTLGRGASDLTAVALAAALKADWCEIYTDVEGVYTADPNLCPRARKLKRISYDEMLELAGLGAKVLQLALGRAGAALQCAAGGAIEFQRRGGNLGGTGRSNRWKTCWSRALRSTRTRARSRSPASRIGPAWRREFSVRLPKPESWST